MSKSNHTSIRLIPRQHAYIRAKAFSNARSMSCEIEDLIINAMHDDPIRFSIRRHAASLTGEVYTAAIGYSHDDFYEGPSEDAAVEATLTKIKELGLALRDVKITIDRQIEMLDGSRRPMGDTKSFLIKRADETHFHSPSFKAKPKGDGEAA